MRTAGVDLASQAASSAMCVIEWPDGALARVVSLEGGVSDARILEVAAGVDKLGIDVPLGWPRKFARAVARHSRTGTWDRDYDHVRDAIEYRLRATDRYIAEKTGADGRRIIPLSVSTDRIGVPALRAAALVSRLPPPVQLDGSGLVVEAYPAGALFRWGLPHRQYKGASEANRQHRREVVERFTAATTHCLILSSDSVAACEASDHLFDALVAACVARAAAIGEVLPIPRRLRSAARREGWIALPRRRALERLGGRPTSLATPQAPT